jgi:hypothetical protein
MENISLTVMQKDRRLFSCLEEYPQYSKSGEILTESGEKQKFCLSLAQPTVLLV